MLMVVTGVAGFIGSHLADRLLGQGHRVVGVDNLSRGMRENLSEALGSPDFHFIEGDVSEPATLLGALAPHGPADVIWHLAANSDIAAGVADSRIDIRDTFMTTYGALEIAKAMSAKRLAFASTSAVYGDHPDALTETHPMLPISNYGAMKLAGEALISAAAESHLDRAWLFRFPNVVGGRATHGVINDLFLKLKRDPAELEVLGDGKQQKPYLHVSDLLEAMFFIVANGGDARRQIYNIGPEDDGFDVASIAAGVIAASGTGARIRYTGGDRGWVGDVPRFSYSVDKLARLGWRPSMSSADAIARAIGEVAIQRGFA